MSKRIIMIHQGKVKIVKSGQVFVKRLEDQQRGVSYRLKINGQNEIIQSDIRLLVQNLSNVNLSQCIIEAFTLVEEAEITNLRKMFPKFWITHSIPKHGGRKRES